MKFELRSGAVYPFIMVAILGAFFLADGFFGSDYITDGGPEESSLNIVEETPGDDPPASSEEGSPEADDFAFTSEEEETPEETTEEIGAASAGLSFGDGLDFYLDSIRATLVTGEKRQDVVVRYYPHTPDGNIIYQLEELGYYVHQRETTEGLENVQTNSIYYGDAVDVRDIQYIARYLISQGIVIRQITPSRFHADWKANAIEIGASVQAQSNEPLTVDDLASFRKAY